MKIRLLHEWPRYVRSQRPRENWRGPRRALPLDEQAEILRAMREAKAARTRHRTARDLADRYGVSLRTIWRYADTLPVPDGLEFLRMRLTDWNQERGLGLTRDDLATLLMVIVRHRDLYPTSRAVDLVTGIPVSVPGLQLRRPAGRRTAPAFRPTTQPLAGTSGQAGSVALQRAPCRLPLCRRTTAVGGLTPHEEPE